MKLFEFLMRSSRRLLVLAVITGFLSGASSAALIALISTAISHNLGASVGALAIGFAGIALISALTSYLSQTLLISLSQRAVFQLRTRLSQQILAAELNHLEHLGTPRLLATLTEDVQAVSNAVYVMPFVCIDLAIVAGCLVYLLWLYWSVFLLVLVFMAIGLGTCQALLSRGRRLLVQVREEQDQLFTHFRALIEGIKELKLNARRRSDFLANDLQATANAFRRDNTRSLMLFASTGTWGRLLLFFAIGLVLFALPSLLQIAPQALAGYILTFVYLMTPMDELVNSLPQLTRANVALQKIASLGLSLDQQAERSMLPVSPQSHWQSLELNQVTYTYRGEDNQSFTLGPLKLTLYPGQLIFIIGGNGSGKSTLAKLITGLYTPESGEIYLDGKRIDQRNREWYRERFSVVFSDFYLFDRLLGLENLALDVQAQAYLKQLQLEHKVKIENGKFSTTNLSQGQRKRLALLTAYLEDRPIYLFDEWAADQDPVFKDLFYTQLLPELKSRGKTVLVISHDDRYFQLADRRIKLDYGKVQCDERGLSP